MKKINLYVILISFLLVINTKLSAQQDYQIVQSFKDKNQQIESAIKNAQSLDQLKQIQSQIDQLKSDFQSHRDLLDKSLYPEDFDSSIEKLNEDLNQRENDFGQITSLQTQVSQLKVQIDTLNAKNADLLNQVLQIQEQNKKDIARLQRTIHELRYSLVQRDRLVMSILGGMLPPSYETTGQLSAGEKEKIYSRAKKTDLISNLKRSIDDNIKFLQVTTLSPSDLRSIKGQEKDLDNMWKNVGPEIINIYSSKKEKTKDVTEIDSAFSGWRNAIDQEAWNSIRQKFVEHGITLDSFSNGDEFTQTLSNYIDDQIKNSDSDSKRLYENFADTLWAGQIKPGWIPYLTESNMITNVEKDKIESEIAQWKNAVSSSSLTWLYILIAVVLIVVVFLIVKSQSSKKKIKIEESNA